MKFVCDRCQTRYSIADEKVRQKILRIRCKNCGNVIVVQEGGLHGLPEGQHGTHEPGRPAPATGPKAAPSGRQKGVPSSGPKASPSGHAKAGAAMARGGGPPPPPPPRSGRGQDSMGGHVEWYVAVEGVQSGPFSRVEAAKRVLATPEGQDVHVWKEGMSGWKPPREVSVIDRELHLLRPAPKAPASTTPLPASSASYEEPSEEILDEATTVTPPPDLTDQNVPAWSTEVTKPGNEEVDLFSEITTQRARDLHEVVGGAKAASFADVTTKKGKNLRDLEAEDAATTPPPRAIEAEATPPPIGPLPPVGAKGSAHTGAKPSVPVPAKHLPASASAPHAAAKGSVTPRPVTAPAPPGAPGGERSPTPGVSSAGASVPVRTTTPRPVVDLASPVSQPTAPRGAGAMGPPQSSSIASITPPSSASMSGSSLPPMLVEFTTPQSLAEFSPQPVGTPQPAELDAFGAGVAPAVSSEMEPQLSAPAQLFQRRPGLKYIVAVLAIVVLIILLVLVILRSDREKSDEPPMPAQEEPTQPEPAEVEEPKVEKPIVAEAPAVADPVPQTEETVEGTSAPTGRRGTRRSARSARSRQERVPKPKPDRKPPRLAGALPNPFDDSRSVSQSQITAVVRNPANQAGLKACYERALKMDNHLTSGRIDVTVSVAASGAVRRVVINAPPSFILVEPCIKSAVKRWVFPSNIEEYGTNFPLILQGGM